MPRRKSDIYPPLVPPIQGPLEPDMTFDLRWVYTLAYHPDEPQQRLRKLREVKNKNPIRFYDMYTEWQDKYEAILAKQNTSDPSKQSKEDAADLERCVQMCEDMIADYLEKESKP